MFILFQLLLILVGVISGTYLWHLGGQGHKWARGWVLPILLALLKVCMNFPYFSFWTLLYAPLLIILVKTFSYGLDSKVHNLLEWLLGKGENGTWHLMEVITRFICGFFWSLAGIAFVLGGGSWIPMVAYSIFFILVNGLVGGLAHNVKFSEKTIGGAISCSLFI
jgi:hypothetical protein